MSAHRFLRQRRRRSPNNSIVRPISLSAYKKLAAATVCCLTSVSVTSSAAAAAPSSAASAFVAAARLPSTSSSPSLVRSSFQSSRYTSRLFHPSWTRLYSATAFSSGEEMNPPISAVVPEEESAFRAALCQFLVGEDKQANLQRAKKFIRDAKDEHAAKLVVLPEIWNSPYATAAFPQYAERLPSLGQSFRELNAEAQPSSYLLGSAAHEHKLWLVGGSIPEVVMDESGDDASTNNNNKYYNTCLVFNPDGIVVAKHRKVHLFDIDVPNKIRFMESDTLSPGNSFTSFDSPFGIIGIGICYDIRFPEYSQVLAQKYGAKILVFPGAFNLTTGPLHWELLQRGRAVDNQCWVLTASPARSSPSTSTSSLKFPPYSAWGHSSAVDPWGTVVATADEGEAIVVVDVELDKVDDIRSSIPIYPQRRNDLYSSAQPIA